MTGDRADAQRHLGEELRTRRHAAGLTGHALAAIIGLDQSRISRIELGRLRISEPELQRWLQETSTPPEVCAQITNIAQRARGAAVLWRNVPISGWSIQARDISALESAASRVAVWQSSTIPDVLQTAAYMHWLAVTVAANSKQRLAANILAKVVRQKILYETPSRLDVVISERALRRPSEDRGIMIDQLHWIGSLARYGRFNLGILTANAAPHIDRNPSFTIYMSPNKDADDLAVQISDDVTISPEAKPENVRHYIDQFRDYQRRSLRGDQAIEFVEGLAREMSSGGSGASVDDGGCDGA